MVVTRGLGNRTNLNVEDNEFEQVRWLRYLEVTKSNKNIMHKEINVKFNMASLCYFAIENLLKTKFI